VLVTGPSGSGKSTLLRAMAGLLLTAADGDLGGDVLIDGVAVAGSPRRPGLLLQDPSAGIVAETVGRDVAFGLENLAVPPAEIWARVRRALTASRFPYPATHPTAALSGGEAQRLALAGSLVLNSPVLLLDEPTSMLDPASASAVMAALRSLVEQSSATLVVVEHRLEPWLGFVDRLVVLGDDGTVVADDEPDLVLAREGASLAKLGVWVPGLEAPTPAELPQALVAPWDSPPGLLVRAEAVWLERTHPLVRRVGPPTQALRGVDATLWSGRALAVTGPSGAGKSSLISVLAGLVTPTSGSVESAAELATRRGRRPSRWRSRDLAARLAWVPQTPEQGIVARTVRDEVLVAARACGRESDQARRRADGILAAFGLQGLAGASPYHLSGGEQRRLMVAAALSAGPAGMLLDEPTIGQDRLTWAAVVGAVASARSEGMGVAVASHDLVAVQTLADDVVALEHGALVP
jgi:energy-coupling factor transport system ATP-binding protein